MSRTGTDLGARIAGLAVLDDLIADDVPMLRSYHLCRRCAATC